MRVNLPVSQQGYTFSDEQSLVSVTDLKGRIVYCNPWFVAVSGYERAELMGQPHNLVRHPDMPQEAFRDMWDTIGAGQPWQGLVKNRRKNGDHYWVDANATPIRRDGRIVGFLSVRTSPKEEQVSQAEATYARMRAEAERGRMVTCLRSGRLVRRDLPGRAFAAGRRVTGYVGAPGLVVLGAVMGVGALASLFTPLVWVPAGLAMAALGHEIQRRRAIKPLRGILEDALQLAAGDLVHRVSTGLPGLPGELQRALNQLSVNLRTVIADISTETVNLGNAVAEIAVGNQDLSSRTEAQASNLEQTAASMEQITGTVKQSSSTVMEGARVAGEAASIAQHSNEAVTGVVNAMSSITDSSRRIGEINSVIEGVAFQTNILALNAAVEAARAGEAGRGFAVVAAEVRALSQRTAEAARQINHLITESAQRVAGGSAQTQLAQERMKQVLVSVSQVSALLGEVSKAGQEQQLGLSQVNSAVAQMDTITQQNASMVEELAASAQELNGQVATVSGALNLFRLRASDRSIAEVSAVDLRRTSKAGVHGE
ncbi:chemotaxis protein [Hydrogenophaga crassostreae]|uniref:Chemotaxis protein n=1 Tax=Hydrogenophaga crassostreae TaxID=1763535 RepID=A0A162YPZ8_9BURK|nr:PAS domain-containing methyl-accepting chemotaxis protein [Hydrogenophaga crassostreae]AOW15214.1 chemotaxis protein [Hydrogenophaga crassostreae]OAD39302.1 chemotaxis protein [Hydrogenophaga crassostreae]